MNTVYSYFTVRRMAFTAMFTALICVIAPFSIPIGPIPISLATFIIYIAAGTLEWKSASLAVVLYVALGAVGLPVFTGFAGGFHKIAGVTGGYIVGYIPCVLAIGLTVKALGFRQWSYIPGMVIGTVLLYTCGTAWFMLVSHNTLAASLAMCVTPFLIGDIVKIVLASVIAPVLRKTLERYP